MGLIQNYLLTRRKNMDYNRRDRISLLQMLYFLEVPWLSERTAIKLN